MMKKKGGMTKKRRKETPAENLARELLTDHGAQSPGTSQNPTADIVASPPGTQAAWKKKIILRNQAATERPSLEIPDLGQREEIAISDEEDTEPIGRAHKRLRGNAPTPSWFFYSYLGFNDVALFSRYYLVILQILLLL
jgi:hypothetical protein